MLFPTARLTQPFQLKFLQEMCVNSQKLGLEKGLAAGTLALSLKLRLSNLDPYPGRKVTLRLVVMTWLDGCGS